MKIKLLIGLLILNLLIVSGCRTSKGCELGLFPSEEDFDYCSQKRLQEFSYCMQIGGDWNSEKQICEPRQGPKGCFNLTSLDIIETTDLPIGYENITDYLESDYLTIQIYCGNFLLKQENRTCEEFVAETNKEWEDNYFDGILLYRFMGGYRLEDENKTIELCWE